MQFVISLTLLMAAASINSWLVHAQDKRKWLTRRFQEKAVIAHALAILPLWGAFFIFTVASTISNSDISNHQLEVIGGTSLLGFGFLLMFLSLGKLGFGSLVNLDKFSPQRRKPIESGIFRYLNNPMYLGFDSVVAGLGVMFANYYTVITAGLMYVALNLVQARIETR